MFWVTVPFAVVGTLAGWLIVPRTADAAAADRRFDGPGALLLMPALTALLLTISESAAWGLASPLLRASGAAAVILLAGFIRRQLRAPAPLLNLGLFRAPAFAGGVLAIVLSYALLYGMFFLMSFALVRGYGDQPLAAGVRLAIVPVLLGIIAPFTGALQARLGLRVLLLGGMAACCAALILLTRVMDGTPASLGPVMAALGLFGAGLGLFIAPNNSATMSAAPAARSGQAGGLLNLARMLGTSLGVACASALLAWRLHVYTGAVDTTRNLAERHLLSAIADGLWLLVAFALVAGLMGILRGRPGSDPRMVGQGLEPHGSLGADEAAKRG